MTRPLSLLRPISLLVFCVGLAGCQQRDFHATTEDTSPGPHLAPLACGNGEDALSFSIFPAGALPDTVVVDGAATPAVLAPSSETGNLRLDLCFDAPANKADLRRVVFELAGQARIFALLREEGEQVDWSRRGEGTVFLIPKKLVKIQGLEDALMGDAGRLDLALPLHEGTVLRAIGVKVAEKWSVAAGTLWTRTSHMSEVIAGTLEVGDTFAKQQCKTPGDRYGEVTVTLGTAKITLGTCGHSTGVSGQVFSVVRVRVLDTNPALPPDAPRDAEISDEYALSQAVQWKCTHHNQCDSFRVDLGNAVYAWTRINGFGCDDVVADAPKISQPAPAGAWAFRIRYGQVWTEGISP